MSMAQTVQLAALQCAVGTRETANGILLTRRQAHLIEQALGVSTGDTVLLVGTGYRGHGLYVWLCDYVDEGPHYLGSVYETIDQKRVDIRGDLLRSVRSALELGKRDTTGRVGLGAMRMRSWQGVD